MITSPLKAISVVKRRRRGAARGGSQAGAGRSWYVSPSGVSTNAGTQESPWDLATAAAGGNPAGQITAGDTVWLRGGTYGAGDGNTVFTASLVGAAGKPITVRQFPGERATINGHLIIGGSDTNYSEFEVTNTNASSAQTEGVHVTGVRIGLIHLVVHEHSSNGIFIEAGATDSFVYGPIVFNNGWSGQDPTHSAHGVYVQSTSGGRLIKHGLYFNNYGFGVHVFTEGGAQLNNVTATENTCWCNGIGGQSGMSGGWDYQFGGGTALVNPVFTFNRSYRVAGDRFSTATIGDDGSPQMAGGTVTDNYLVGQVHVANWDVITWQRNSCLLAEAPFQLETSGTAMPTGDWGANIYSTAASSFYEFLTLLSDQGTPASTGYQTFADWQTATGLDATSTFTGNAAPATNLLVVQPSPYVPGRGNILLWNWQGLASASVDLGAVLAVGQAYEIRDAQNFYAAAVTSGTYTGSPVSIPIASRTPATALGAAKGTPVGTGTEFQAFVVLPA